MRIATALDAGQDRLDDLDLDTLRRDGLDETLNAAADDLESAHDLAESSPFLGALAPIPLLGTQVDAVRDLTAVGDQLGAAARETGATVAEALERAGSDPAARVELLDIVLAELDRVEAIAIQIDIGAEGPLVPPLFSARRSVEDAIGSVSPRFADLRAQVTSLRTLLAGPTSYLINVGNNAEMRAGAGMPLSAGLATIVDGDIQLGDFLSTVSEMYEPDPTGEFNANIPPPVQRTYPRWEIGESFPETAVTPNFTFTGPIYADIAEDTQGWRVEGVIHVDAYALVELLEVIGPVEIGGVEYTTETAPQLVLNEPYIAFDTLDERADRLTAQSDLAKELFEAIKTRDVDLVDLVAALQTAADGRHLMAWSRDPVLQDLFDSIGLDGLVGPFDTMVSFLNTSANKLDWYIEPEIEVTTQRLEDDVVEVELLATIPNPDGIRTSGYIDGNRPELAGGKHRTLMMVMVPRFATDLSFEGFEENEVIRISEQGLDGFSRILGSRFVIDRGSTKLVRVTFRLPANSPALSVLPSARAKPVPWTVNGTEYTDDLPFVAPIPGPDDGDVQRYLLAAAALLGAVGAALLTRIAWLAVARDESIADIPPTRLDALVGVTSTAVAALLLFGSFLV